MSPSLPGVQISRRGGTEVESSTQSRSPEYYGTPKPPTGPPGRTGPGSGGARDHPGVPRRGQVSH
eukprot:760955-Hanusia_phi.AAC.9